MQRSVNVKVGGICALMNNQITFRSSTNWRNFHY